MVTLKVQDKMQKSEYFSIQREITLKHGKSDNFVIEDFIIALDGLIKKRF